MDAIVGRRRARRKAGPLDAHEQHAKGRAIEADLEEGWNGATYEVKVITPTARMIVVVDASSGAVVSAQEKSQKKDHD